MEHRSNKNKRKDEGKNSLSQSTQCKKKRYVYIYGNYHSYYSYRIGQALDEDPRMKVLKKEWFENKDCLDIGCNEGFITISIAQKFACQSIMGVDIDDRLIGKARNHLKTVASIEEGIERNEQSVEEKHKVKELKDINMREQSYEDEDRVDGLESIDKEQSHKDDNSENGLQGIGRRKQFSEDEDERVNGLEGMVKREQSCEDDNRQNGLQGTGRRKQFPEDEDSAKKLEIICKKSVRDRISIFSRDSISDNVEGRVRDHNLLERVSFRTENFIQKPYSESDATYDTVLCLSVTKWVHLNWCDTGLIRLFAKMWKVLRPGGILILEPQPWKSYERKHFVSEAAAENFHNIVYRPDVFRDILLDKIGFRSMERISTHVPNSTVGFDRPIYILQK